MNREEFESKVSKAKQINPLLFEFGAENQVIELDNILEIESECSVIFPESFKYSISTYGAGHFAITSALSPLADGEDLLWQQKSLYSLAADYVPISENGCGDHYGFKVTDGV